MGFLDCYLYVLVPVNSRVNSSSRGWLQHPSKRTPTPSLSVDCTIVPVSEGRQGVGAGTTGEVSQQMLDLLLREVINPPFDASRTRGMVYFHG